MLSRKLLLDIVFDSEDFKHLWIIEENAPKEYRLDFFLNPPENQSYVKVQVWFYIHKMMFCIINNHEIIRRSMSIWNT